MQNNKQKKSLFEEFPPISTEKWEEKLKSDLKTDNPDAKLLWKIAEGINIKGIYRSDDLEGCKPFESMPGSYPYLRGTKTNNNWEINRIIETSEPAEANKLALYAIKRGANSIEFNCSQIRKADSLASLLKDIDLENISIRFDKPMSFKIILKHFITFVEESKFEKSKIKGSFNWDAMAYRLISGQYYQTLDNNIDELVSLINEAELHFPNFKILTINAQHFHNGGSTVVQELAFTLSAAVEYTHRLLEKGISLSVILKHIQFRMAIGSAYFIEIAKFRALRFLWAKIITAFNPELKENAKAYIHAQSSMWNKSLFDPYVNMLRTTTETMSASIAGVDVISVLPFDKTYHKENEFGSRISQNQQTLIKEEAHFDKVVDAAGGSYYIENMSKSIIESSWELFNDIEDKGGYAVAMESDFIKDEITKSAVKKEYNIATRKLNILGTNQFPNQLEFMLDEIELETKGKPAGVYLHRAAQEFEEIRLQVENSDKRPKLQILSFGDITMRKARAGFIANFFACAGYEIIENDNCKSASEGLEEARSNKADITVLCSSDGEYLDFANDFNKGIQAADFNTIVLVAGNPKEDIDNLKKAGVEDFIHVRTNVLESLLGFNSRIIK